ncbi:class F sortase [Planococcus halotolerans]|uniref:Peptidase C60 sortase A and B n=1 Tax=Planococcus halotolerans TaxID=2233542 RepID=A0A365L0L9_9BACL|nr:class F sortase [Planococcus halotolerans]QHJ71327.1 sortase [Planococcus halotolerans]RAZ78912.1 peptidase C60 sortase A and B [Planococcus halotolerans]
MNGFAKKFFLIYFLFLLTTLSDTPRHSTELISTEAEQDFVPAQTEVTQEDVQQPTLPVAEKLDETKVDVPKTTAEALASAPSEPDLSGITPAVIEIPAIGERAEVIEVGLTEDGAMEAPASIYEIGWYALGTKPGSRGNAVMAGHVDGLTSPGTFYNLKKLEPGDKIHITGTEGEKLTFVVTEKKAYVPEEAPLEKIFGPSSGSHLNLITCTGTFNDETDDYEERLVVYTDLVEN